MTAQISSDLNLIGIVISRYLYHNDQMGYSLLITEDTIIGAKKMESLGDLVAYLGPNSTANDPTRTMTKKIARELEVSRDLIIPADSVSQILLKKPGLFFGGFIIIKTTRGTFRVGMRLLSVGGSELVDASNVLADSLRALVGGRLRVIEKGFAITTGWTRTSHSYFDKQSELYKKLNREEHLRIILKMLAEHKEGLTDAEIDATLSNYSQWTTLLHLRELLSTGLIEYKPELFGNPGRYFITELGISTLKNITN